jgi:hypothetical protein
MICNTRIKYHYHYSKCRVICQLLCHINMFLLLSLAINSNRNVSFWDVTMNSTSEQQSKKNVFIVTPTKHANYPFGTHTICLYNHTGHVCGLLQLLRRHDYSATLRVFYFHSLLHNACKCTLCRRDLNTICDIFRINYNFISFILPQSVLNVSNRSWKLHMQEDCCPCNCYSVGLNF